MLLCKTDRTTHMTGEGHAFEAYDETSVYCNCTSDKTGQLA